MGDLSLWLQLWHTSGLGPVKIARLLERFGSVQAVFAASSKQLEDAGLSSTLAQAVLDKPASERIDAALEWQTTPDNHILTLDSPQYPALLQEIPRPPAILFVKGDTGILNDPQLAMVGSRNPSQTGTDNAFQFAKHLGQSGIISTSGLALGIDGASHRGAMAANSPTIAVVATGLDRVYPARHKELAQQILDQGGAIISELPLGSSPKAENFPARNRIIAGLSIGTLVVEAALRSGSLITARDAREMGREVFAIPGSIHNPMSKGCHALIKQGAKLVESAADILEELAPQLKEAIITSSADKANSQVEKQPPYHAQTASTHADKAVEQNNEHQKLLDAMGYDPTTIDQLSTQTDFAPAELASMLLIMELEGLVSSEPGGRYQRRK